MTITEQTGAKWVATQTGQQGGRAYWVSLKSGRSMAKPWIVGFYSASIDAAAAELSN